MKSKDIEIAEGRISNFIARKYHGAVDSVKSTFGAKGNTSGTKRSLIQLTNFMYKGWKNYLVMNNKHSANPLSGTYDDMLKYIKLQYGEKGLQAAMGRDTNVNQMNTSGLGLDSFVPSGSDINTPVQPPTPNPSTPPSVPPLRLAVNNQPRSKPPIPPSTASYSNKPPVVPGVDHYLANPDDQGPLADTQAPSAKSKPLRPSNVMRGDALKTGTRESIEIQINEDARPLSYNQAYGILYRVAQFKYWERLYRTTRKGVEGERQYGDYEVPSVDSTTSTPATPTTSDSNNSNIVSYNQLVKTVQSPPPNTDPKMVHALGVFLQSPKNKDKAWNVNDLIKVSKDPHFRYLIFHAATLKNV